jgi:hypothetical protein
MAEIGCLKDGYFNNLEVEKSFIHKKNSRIVFDKISGDNNASLTKYDCGIVFLNGTESSASATLPNDVNIHLPPASTGLHYKFILNASMISGSGTFVITTPDNASFVGSINASGMIKNASQVTGGDKEIIFGTGSLPGDFVDINCYSDTHINRWHTFGNSSDSGATSGVYFHTT